MTRPLIDSGERIAHAIELKSKMLKLNGKEIISPENKCFYFYPEDFFDHIAYRMIQQQAEEVKGGMEPLTSIFLSSFKSESANVVTDAFNVI